jgi:tetratricopeptide (TPR) repeat protein
MKNKIIILSFVLSLVIINNSYALNLEKLKVYFLQGNYSASIKEGEKVLAGAQQSPELAELYCILGISYLKDGNFLRASDIFEIILKEFKKNKFSEQARLGLGDSYFLRGDLQHAEQCYKQLLEEDRNTNLKPELYYRFSRLAFKKGDILEGKEYLDKLNKEFPLNLEAKQADEASAFYSVQVGAFSNKDNAKNLLNKLIKQGYEAYMEESNILGRLTYRVKVGKATQRAEIAVLENKLSRDGYPTKVLP